MREVDVSSQAPMRFVRALVLGAPGTGKTHFAATCPRPLFISDAAEGGFATIQAMDPAYWWNEREKPEVWAIENAFADIPKMLGELESMKAKNEFRFRTVVIDPVSVYADRVIAEMEERASTAAMKSNKSVDRRALYGDLLLHMRVQLMRFHALPANIIWLCHVKDGGIAIPGQTADKFPAYMDFKWMVANAPGLNGPDYTLHTQPTGAFGMLGGRWSVKDASGKRWGLPSPMVPSFKCIAQILGMERAPSPAVPGFPDGVNYEWPPRIEGTVEQREADVNATSG